MIAHFEYWSHGTKWTYLFEAVNGVLPFFWKFTNQRADSKFDENPFFLYVLLALQ